MIFDRTNTVALLNQASGTLAQSVADTADVVTFTQTTASVTVNLPNPTSIAGHRIVSLHNLPASSQILNVGGVAAGSDVIPLAIGDTRKMIWNGSTWRSPAAPRTLILTNAILSGLLGGVTWTITAAAPVLLTTSVAMTGVAKCRLQAVTGATADWNTWCDGGSGGGGASMLQRGKPWGGATSGNIGIFSASYSCTMIGMLTGNGRTFRISGGSMAGVNMAVIIEIVT